MSPWAMLANSAPLTPVGVMLAMPRRTKPMWPTEEYAMSRFRSPLAPGRASARQASDP